MACLLGEQFCWHPVLPDPAPPPRHAPRPDPPVVCPGFGLDKNTANNLTFNVELADGDLDVAVDKLGEVQADVREVVVVVAVDPPAGAAGRRSKTPETGALKTPVSK